MKLPVSICIIAKNEENNLPQLFESIKELAEEIILTDTGSTDKTKDIALNYGAKIYDFEWSDDFSKARNFCISKATQKWIFFMDADYLFLKDSYEELIKCINNDDYQI